MFLPADTFATRQPDPVLQQLEHESSVTFSTNDAFQAVSRYWDRINRPEQLMSALLRAFEVMTNPATTGPATICLPQDVESEAYDYPVEFFRKRVHYIDRRMPTIRELETASHLIKDSKHPVIIVGAVASIQKQVRAFRKFLKFIRYLWLKHMLVNQLFHGNLKIILEAWEF